jgi:hypothetical protein
VNNIVKSFSRYFRHSVLIAFIYIVFTVLVYFSASIFVQVLLPSLKYVRGEMFSDKHWLEMFGVLGMSNKSVEMLTFADFLNVKEKIAANVTALQVRIHMSQLNPSLKFLKL